MISRSLEVVPCNLCGFSSVTVIYPAQYEKEKDADLTRKFRASGDELLIDQLVSCNRCGLIYISPRIKGNVIIQSYSAGEDPVFVSQASAREKTFDKSLKEIERYSSKGNLLDVGTAGGSFLAAAGKRGWSVFGCEPNRWLAAWARKNYGVPVAPGTIFDQKYKTNFFDVVTLWDVIEHTPDPCSVLRECNRVLKQGGLLVVNYPDIGSWIARLMGRKWLFLTSVHLYYFNRITMKRMLERTGFRIKILRPHFQSLELDYILQRGAIYSKIISKTGRFFVHLLGMQEKMIPYWLGQTFIIAEKKPTI